MFITNTIEYWPKKQVVNELFRMLSDPKPCVRTGYPVVEGELGDDARQQVHEQREENLLLDQELVWVVPASVAAYLNT
jgi:hypothetical protein